MTNLDDKDFVSAAFAELSETEPSPTLRRRVAQIPIEHPRRKERVWPLSRVWQSVLSFGALCVLGVVTGSTLPAKDQLTLNGAPLPNAALRGSESLAANTKNGEDLSAARFNGVDSEASNEDFDVLSDAELEDPLQGLFALALSEDWESWDGANVLDSGETMEEVAQ